MEKENEEAKNTKETDKEKPRRRGKPTREQKAPGEKYHHVAITLPSAEYEFLKQLSHIRSETYSELIIAMIRRAKKDNAELVKLIQKAKTSI